MGPISGAGQWAAVGGILVSIFVVAAPVSLNAGETKNPHAVPLAAESRYDFRELGVYLGKVGLIEPGFASDTFPSGSTRAGRETVEAMDFTL